MKGKREPQRAATGRPIVGETAPPMEFAGDRIVWAAWLYYEDGLTQGEIADLMGLSRATVVNLLQEARDQGIVKIEIAPGPMTSVSLARRVAAAYGLDACAVTADDGGRTPSHERIGRLGARILADSIEDEDVLGVAWGRTVMALSNALPSRDLPHLSVVQVFGSSTSTYAFSPELCTSNIANRLGGRCIQLHAPGVVSRPEVRRILMEEPALREQFAIIRSCTKIVYGVTNMDTTSMVYRSGFLTPEQAKPYRDKGAIGFMVGHFFDAEGRPVEGELDERLICVPLEQIKRTPEKFCIAGGADKAEAIRALLMTGLITTLVTDIPAAEQLLRMKG